MRHHTDFTKLQPFHRPQTLFHVAARSDEKNYCFIGYVLILCQTKRLKLALSLVNKVRTRPFIKRKYCPHSESVFLKVGMRPLQSTVRGKLKVLVNQHRMKAIDDLLWFPAPVSPHL
jgi:hypothetical protein